MKTALFTLLIIAAFSFAQAGNTVKSDINNKSTEAASANVVNTASISGKVIDLNSGEALAGVEVTIEGSTKKVRTDLDGNYKINNIQPGAYNLIASYISYNKSFIEKLKIEKSGQEVNIKLQSSN